MGSVSITAEHLSKRYILGEKQGHYSTLRDTLMDALQAPVRALRSKTEEEKEEALRDRTVWALNDVSFEVKRGDVVGVIGRNGSGKSTLLKVLARITDPTAGKADLYGRLGSLLEVGTGFHNELSGRENIFLNGAVLGMKKADIVRKFDDIVSFAEVEKFIDTPVKHYSTGMYLRLAFAVAAHLEPEILLVDEVLAVGDMSFQKKCLGKMDSVAKEGRTILFVSHNMGAVRSLCNKGIVLHQGRIVYSGDISACIAKYHNLMSPAEAEAKPLNVPAKGFGFGQPHMVSHPSPLINQSDEFEVEVQMHIGREVAGFILLTILDDMNQRRVFHVRRDSSDFAHGKAHCGAYRIRVKLPTLWLEPGLYSLYFKAVFQGQDASEKIMSDVLHLDVGGQACGWGSIMSPDIDLKVEEVEERSRHAVSC